MLLVSAAHAQEAASTQAADHGDTPALVAAGDKAAIDANMEKDVVVEGVIEKAEWSSTGKVMRASFKDAPDTKLAAIIFEKTRPKFDEAYGGDVTKTLAGAKVRLKGKLHEYKGGAEIVLTTVNQITIMEPSATQPAK